MQMVYLFIVQRTVTSSGVAIRNCKQ